MPAFQIDHAVVAQKAARIQALLPELQQLITQHQGHVDTLMTVWKGQSATGLTGVNTQVVQGNNQVHLDFDAFGRNLAENVANYVNADVASTLR
jgi:uncharacterized protein YukE